MSDNVIKLFGVDPGSKDETGYHYSGTVRCLGCKHEWVAVAPIGTIDLECPECGCHRGIPKFPFGPTEDDEVWACGGCGENYFWITRAGTMCISCGKQQAF